MSELSYEFHLSTGLPKETSSPNDDTSYPLGWGPEVAGIHVEEAHFGLTREIAAAIVLASR